MKRWSKAQSLSANMGTLNFHIVRLGQVYKTVLQKIFSDPFLFFFFAIYEKNNLKTFFIIMCITFIKKFYKTLDTILKNTMQ